VILTQGNGFIESVFLQNSDSKEVPTVYCFCLTNLQFAVTGPLSISSLPSLPSVDNPFTPDYLASAVNVGGNFS